MKRSIYLSFLILVAISISSCSALQYWTDFPLESKFLNFKDLGISKQEMIGKYGNPTSTGIAKTGDAVSEILYYAEKLKDFVVTTEFMFKNNKLEEVKTLKIENNYQNDIEYIKWKTEMNGLNPNYAVDISRDKSIG